MHSEPAPDRRRYARHEVKNTIFVAFRPHFDKVGKVKNISCGGLCLEYSKYNDDDGIGSTIEVDIFSQGKDFYLPRVPCKIIYDTRIQHYPSFIGMETKRCGLEFLDLNERQVAQIEFFLQAYSEDEEIPYNSC